MFRRRSSHSSKVGPSRRASIINTLAADGVINDAAATADDAQLIGRMTNPLFNDGAGRGGGGWAESREESVCVCVASINVYCMFMPLSASVRQTPAHQTKSTDAGFGILARPVQLGSRMMF